MKRTCDLPRRRRSTFNPLPTRRVLSWLAMPWPNLRTRLKKARRLRFEIRRLLESEIALARQLFTLVREDSRIGFEPSCQYFYLPLDLVEKVVNCRWLLKHFGE